MVTKDIDFKKMAEQLKALDNEDKLSILSFLTKEGQKSITDISKSLKINFSTTHKYLEQLEAAGLVQSRSIHADRLKRLFTVKDFNICLNPPAFQGRSSEEIKTTSEITLITAQGELCKFDRKMFAKNYYEQGVPSYIIEDGLNSLQRNLYNYATLYELRLKFLQALRDRVKDINNAVYNMEQQALKERTYSSLLALMQPNLIKKHINGEIFIKNIQKPRLLNFSPDIRGISIHGVNGEDPKTLSKFFEQILTVLAEKSSITNAIYCFDSFNYIISIFTKRLSDEELEKQLSMFFSQLNANYLVNIGIDVGHPRFIEKITPMYYQDVQKKEESYLPLKSEAERVARILTKVFKINKFSRLLAIYKVWGTEFSPPPFQFYLANMNPEWQTDSACYIGNRARFDTSWKGWMTINRVGELQDISINLCKIAKESNSISEFSDKIRDLVEECINAIIDITEIAVGELRRNSTILPSVRRGKWDYIQTGDCVYSISFAGLARAGKTMCNNDLKKAEVFVEDLLKMCNSIITKKDLPIRIQMKEEYDKIVLQRFEAVTKQSITENADQLIAAKLHKYLKGGHCTKLNRDDIGKFLRSEGGLAIIE